VSKIKNQFERTTNTESWFNWCTSLLDLYETEKHYLIGSDIQKVSSLGMRRWILSQAFDGKELLLRNLLLDAMVSANVSTGAEIYVPWFLYNELSEVSVVKRLDSDSYLAATLSKTKLEFASLVFESLWAQVGPLTKIIVKPSFEGDVVIKHRNSFRFPLSLDAQFHRVIGHVEFIELTNPIIIMIEGAPETIGEINSLLHHNHQSKRPVVLIARSFPEEISATLATNWLKNSLNVMPLVYGDSLETMNLAADMCSVTRGELVSPHFGDVIASAVLDEDKWGTADKIEWTSRGLSIYKQVNVTGHINSLLEKIKKTDVEDMQKIYQDRILSLSNDAVELWVPEKEKQLIEELDSLIKHYNGFVVSGAVETPLGLLPKCFVDAAQTAAQSLKKEILNIGGFLVRAKDEVVA
jgi:hypothetical protein